MRQILLEKDMVFPYSDILVACQGYEIIWIIRKVQDYQPNNGNRNNKDTNNQNVYIDKSKIKDKDKENKEVNKANGDKGVEENNNSEPIFYFQLLSLKSFSVGEYYPFLSRVCSYKEYIKFLNINMLEVWAFKDFFEFAEYYVN
jgi:hypothetical protein